MKKKGNSHDHRYKMIFSDPVMVESLLREFTPKKFVADLDFSSLTRIACTYNAENGIERRNDMVWRIGLKNGSSLYIAVMLEFQSTQHKWMPVRILTYTALLLSDLIKQPDIGDTLPPILPIVLYNGKTPWKVPIDVGSMFTSLPENMNIHCPRQQYLLLDEGRIPEDRLNRSKEPVSDVIKMERACTPAQIKEVVDRLNNLTDHKYHSIKKIISAWICQIVKSSGFIKDIPELQDLQEVGAMLAKNIANWEENWKEQYIDQGIKQGIMQGRKEGRKEGMAEGRKEGMAEGRGLLLRDLLEDRFGSLPDSVTSYIDKSSDSDALRKFALFATQAQSLQAIIDQIKVMTGSDCTGQSVQPA